VEIFFFSKRNFSSSSQTFFWQSYQLFGTEKKLSDNKKCTFKKFFGFGIPGWVVGDNGKWQQKSIDFDTSSVANKHRHKFD